MCKKYDESYKRNLKKKKEFIHFLRKYIGEEWTQEIRPDQIQLSDKEFIFANFKKRESDVLWEIKLSRQNIYVYTVLELQTEVDFTMPVRTLVYMLGTLLKIFEETDEKERERKSFRLPTVVAIVFHNGEGRWSAPTRFRDYQEGYELFGSHGIDFEYYLIDLSEVPKEYILSTNTLIDNMFALDQTKEKEELLDVLEEVEERVAELTTEEQIEFSSWIEEVIEKMFPDEESLGRLREELREREVNSMTYAIERIIRREKEEGMREGLREGEMIGQEKSMERLKKLAESLTRDGKSELLIEAVQDRELQEKLYADYDIEV